MIANCTINTLETYAANEHKAALFLTVNIYVLRIREMGRGIRSFILFTLQFSHYVPFIDPVGQFCRPNCLSRPSYLPHNSSVLGLRLPHPVRHGGSAHNFESMDASQSLGQRSK